MGNLICFYINISYFYSISESNSNTFAFKRGKSSLTVSHRTSGMI